MQKLTFQISRNYIQKTIKPIKGQLAISNKIFQIQYQNNIKLHNNKQKFTFSTTNQQENKESESQKKTQENQEKENQKTEQNNSNNNYILPITVIGSIAGIVGFYFYKNQDNSSQNDQKSQQKQEQNTKQEQKKPVYKEPKEQDPNYHADIGIDFLDNNKFTEAEKCFQKAIELDPENFFYYYFQGSTLQNLKRYKEAIQYYEKAIEKNPKDSVSYLYKGQILENHYNKLDDAMKCYDTAENVDPQNFDVYIRKAGIYVKKGNPQKALDQYNKAIEINPKEPSIYIEKGYFLTQIRQQKEAIEVFNQAIALDGNNAEAHLNKGNNLAQLGHLLEALKSIKRALEINPNMGEAYITRAILYGQLGEKEYCIKSFERAISFNPRKYTQVAVDTIDQFDFVDEAIKLNPDFWEKYY